MWPDTLPSLSTEAIEGSALFHVHVLSVVSAGLNDTDNLSFLPLIMLTIELESEIAFAFTSAGAVVGVDVAFPSAGVVVAFPSAGAVVGVDDFASGAGALSEPDSFFGRGPDRDPLHPHRERRGVHREPHPGDAPGVVRARRHARAGGGG